MRRTSARSVPTAFQLSIFGQGDSLARTLLCQEKDPGYTEHELACFLNSLDYCGNAAAINPAGLSLKMLRDCFQWAEQGILPRFSLNWPHWGMVLNMRFSTPAHLESLKTGRGYTLSEILQPEVPEKYYLSEQQTERLLTRLLEARREAGSTAQMEYHQLSLPEVEA